MNWMNRALAIASIAEAATGAALLMVPSVVCRQLLGAEPEGLALQLARVAGIAILSLGIACWPGRTSSRAALTAMTLYSVLVCGLLAMLGVQGQWIGPLLWPAVAGHVLIAALLGLSMLKRQ